MFIGESTARLSKEFKENEAKILWLKIKDFRDIVVHDYFGVDAEEVWQNIQDKIPVFFNVSIFQLNCYKPFL